jgi:nitroreductase
LGTNQIDSELTKNMSKVPTTSAPLTDLLSKRWSPRSYDESHELSDQDLLSILEAGRWAPSSSNGQPWRFSVAKRGTEIHQRVVAGLTGFNQAWAPAASALIVVSVKRAEDGTSHQGNHYDAGLAVALMSVQAQALDLYTHQMGGILREQLHEALDLPAELEVLVVFSVGKKDSPEKFEGAALERELAPRSRLELSEIVLHGKP